MGRVELMRDQASKARRFLALLGRIEDIRRVVDAVAPVALNVLAYPRLVARRGSRAAAATVHSPANSGLHPDPGYYGARSEA